jgi:hypothetical protein
VRAWAVPAPWSDVATSLPHADLRAPSSLRPATPPAALQPVFCLLLLVFGLAVLPALSLALVCAVLVLQLQLAGPVGLLVAGLRGTSRARPCVVSVCICTCCGRRFGRCRVSGLPRRLASRCVLRLQGDAGAWPRGPSRRACFPDVAFVSSAGCRLPGLGCVCPGGFCRRCCRWRRRPVAPSVPSALRRPRALCGAGGSARDDGRQAHALGRRRSPQPRLATAAAA